MDQSRSEADHFHPGSRPGTGSNFNMKFTWELTEGFLLADDEEHEYNPRGYWLHNTEVNAVFILPEDVEQIKQLLASLRL
jgi:hypothetical protein